MPNMTERKLIFLYLYRCSLEGEQSSMLYDLSDQRDEVIPVAILVLNLDPVWVNYVHADPFFPTHFRGRAPGKLTGGEDNFARLVWPSSGTFSLQRSSIQIVLATCENQLPPYWKHLIKPLTLWLVLIYSKICFFISCRIRHSIQHHFILVRKWLVLLERSKKQDGYQELNHSFLTKHK